MLDPSTLIRDSLLAAVAALALLVPTTLQAASDNYIPFVEPLQAAQQRAYAQAAPQGQDEPLPAPAIPLTTMDPALAATAEEPSRLEAMAEEKKGPLSLNETQQQQSLKENLQQFGYDIFSRKPTTFAPVDGIPVPQSYRIGPGDNLIVQLYGKRNVEYKLVVTRDGNILIPEYGPVSVAGLSFDEAEALIVDGFQRRVIGARAVVTMGRLRTIQIRLTGDVAQPGVYTVSGLTTLVDALLTTGGIRSTGSLRNIQLVRGGERVASLDLYDLLLHGRSGDDPALKHNDTIFVPPIGNIVYVGGEVQRPAIYELRRGETVGKVLDMAGGLLPTASLADSHIERIQPGGYRSLVDFAATASDTSIRAMPVTNGDLLRILALEDQLENVVLLSGHVERPGGYQYRQSMRLSDLIPSAEALLPGADLDFVLVRREHSTTLRTEVIYTSLLEALEQPGSPADLGLQARDQVFVFHLADNRESVVADVTQALELQASASRPAQVVSLQGAVRFTGKFPLQNDARLLDVIALGGGALPGADLHYGVIARQLHPSRSIEVWPFNLMAASSDPAGEHNPVIRPGDLIVTLDDGDARAGALTGIIERLRQQAGFGAPEKLVNILGEVRHGGAYPQIPGMRASDLLCAAGGLTRKAYGMNAELSRVVHSTTGENHTDHIELDTGVLLDTCALARRAARGDISPEDYLTRYHDDRTNPQLQPMDQLAFSQKPGWVERATITLEGEVLRPGVYAIDRGETLCEVLERAGGVTEDAYAFGAIFTRESVRAMQQETLDALHDQLDDLMVELSLSHSFNNNDKLSREWAGKEDYLKVIRQLERAQANGRLVIDMNDIQRCRSRDALPLEDGDKLVVPRRPEYVQVAGQVYVPTSHLYRDDRKISDYVELSGGETVLGRLDHTYVIQANGEVLNLKGSRSSRKLARKSVMPGARIYVPLNVDRMNGTEKAQTWVQTLVNSAILAGVIL